MHAIRGSFGGAEIELHPEVAAVDVPILGREDFFEHFLVTFNESARTFTLPPVAEAFSDEQHAVSSAVQERT